MTNAELTDAWCKKLPGVVPTERELTVFALGVEAGREIGPARARTKDTPMSTTDDTNATRRGSGSNDLLGLLVSRALFADECQRLAEWALIGPVQRAALKSFAERLLAAERERNHADFRVQNKCIADQHDEIERLRTAARIAREGYASEAATGLPVLPQWRERTIALIDEALKA